MNKFIKTKWQFLFLLLILLLLVISLYYILNKPQKEKGWISPANLELMKRNAFVDNFAFKLRYVYETSPESTMILKGHLMYTLILNNNLDSLDMFSFGIMDVESYPRAIHTIVHLKDGKMKCFGFWRPEECDSNQYNNDKFYNIPVKVGDLISLYLENHSFKKYVDWSFFNNKFKYSKIYGMNNHIDSLEFLYIANEPHKQDMIVHYNKGTEIYFLPRGEDNISDYKQIIKDFKKIQEEDLKEKNK